MWEHYKKTALGIQIVIALVTLTVLAWSRVWQAAGVFFLAMQFSAVLGAGWAARFKALKARGLALRNR